MTAAHAGQSAPGQPMHRQPVHGRTGVLARLTAGWRDSDQPASLHEHARRFGRLPPVHNGRVAGRHLIDMVTAAGLTGRGGAAFPTGVKMRSVAGRRGGAVLVANGMESEPASEKDQALLARSPHLVLDGIELAASAVGAGVAHLCLPRSKGWLTGIMLEAVSQREQAGLDHIPVEIHELPHNYVSSEETALVHWLNGGDARPTAIPPRPFERGVRRRPTLVDNVETLAHVALIARYGTGWFTEAGLADMPGTMLATVTGAVADPGVYEIGGGTRVGDLLMAAQGSADIGAVLIGGYFGSWHPVSQVAGLPFTKAGLARAGGAPGAGVLFALPSDSCGLVEAARILRYLAAESAQQCGPCMFGLPAIAADLSQLAAGRPDGDPLDRLQRRFRQISGRGGCRHPDGAVRMAASALTAFTADVHAHSRHRPCLAAHRGQRRTDQLPVPQSATEGAWR
jgi:NADH:ubiquinone oxidoreductase subunit F (NADH-binding)